MALWTFLCICIYFDCPFLARISFHSYIHSDTLLKWISWNNNHLFVTWFSYVHCSMIIQYTVFIACTCILHSVWSEEISCRASLQSKHWIVWYHCGAASALPYKQSQLEIHCCWNTLCVETPEHSSWNTWLPHRLEDTNTVYWIIILQCMYI